MSGTIVIVPKEILTATVGGLSVLVVTGGSDGDVLTQQADGTYAPETPSGGGGAVTALNNAAANRLVTVGATTTELDAEPRLTFDGAVLKYFDASGGECWRAQTTNKFNMFFGLNSGDACDTDPSTVGGEPGTANTSFGYQTLPNCTSTGRYNSCFGTHAGLAITHGEFNTFVGANAGSSITTTGYNTVVGHNAMQIGTACTGNVGIGHRAIEQATASSTTAIGTFALSSLTSGDFNTAIGYNAGSSQVTGSSNQYFGLAAGNGHTGSQCIIVGVYAEASSAGASNEAVFGSEYTVINDVYFGKGAKHSTATAYRINGTAGTGTNNAGGKVTIAGGKSTGNATPAVVALAASLAGSSGTTTQTLRDGLQIDGNVTAAETPLLLFDIDKGSLQRVSLGAADSGGSGYKLLRVPN
jgi:hypothetical protein